MIKRTKQQVWLVVERDLYLDEYRRIVNTHEVEDDAWREVRWLTRSFSGGGKFYVVEAWRQ